MQYLASDLRPEVWRQVGCRQVGKRQLGVETDGRWKQVGLETGRVGDRWGWRQVGWRQVGVETVEGWRQVGAETGRCGDSGVQGLVEQPF